MQADAHEAQHSPPAVPVQDLKLLCQHWRTAINMLTHLTPPYDLLSWAASEPCCSCVLSAPAGTASSQASCIPEAGTYQLQQRRSLLLA